MARLNLLLFAALLLCALSLVNSQHQSRKLFAALEAQHEKTKQLDIEYGQLQLEQSTWAMHARIEKIAAQQLRMKAPEARRIQIVPPSRPAAPATPEAMGKGAAQ